MDISVYISELLYDHDCVVIPNFGGIVCSYQPAEIHPVLNTISPPSKAIAFNKNLQVNDGLLAQYIAGKHNVDFETALTYIANWTSSAKSLLESGEKVVLHKTGELILDIEKNIQFKAYTRFNYLKSSFALPVLHALPVIHAKERKLEPAKEAGDENRTNSWSKWKIAATVLILVALSALAQLMRMGVEVKQFEISEAHFLNFVEWFSPVKEADKRLLPVYIESTSEETATKEDFPVAVTETNNETSSQQQQNLKQGYYIIIGSFANPANAAAAKEKLLSSNSTYSILEESNGDFTKVGYWAANDLASAREQLSQARVEDSTYWLYRKQ
ncbi:MAG: SPOR domain-containing protein [Chitinophagales bacterium]|nr:SPOR domain-containing protein [Chitinophagales bacterium]